MSTPSSLRILHVATGLEVGGAERTLTQLARWTRERGHLVEVASLKGTGELGQQLRSEGMRVHALNLHQPGHLGRALTLLRRLFHRSKPDLVQTWMHHADVIGGLMVRAVSAVPIVWSLRSSDLWQIKLPPLTRHLIDVGSGLSHTLPRRIIACSHSARDAHVQKGYAAEKITIIPNAVDGARFALDSKAGWAQRRKWGIPSDAVVLGWAGRADAVKAPDRFVRVLEPLFARRPNLHAVMCGPGIERHSALLGPTAEHWLRQGRLHVVGAQSDMPAFYAALDGLVGTSHSEAFPNVLVEALACQVPCISTQVGDAQALMGPGGLSAPRDNEGELAALVGTLVHMKPEARQQMGQAGRKHVLQEFGRETHVQRHLDLYEAL
jgi:glycosyltransferase involved in cell wall biosynthesis